MNFFGGDFQSWKLHTWIDYLSFFLFLFGGVVVFTLIIRYMNKQRTNEKAIRKVVRRLRRLAGKPANLYTDVTFRFEDGPGTYDAVLADKSGIYFVKAYGWGTKIYGTPDGENWRREDPKRREEFPNPLIGLKDGAARLQKVLEERGITRIKIMPMVVFADNYQTPELYLGFGSYSTTYQELKKWYKKQSGVKKCQYDFDRVASILMELQSDKPDM